MDDPSRPWLRGVNCGDQDVLRTWRNAHGHRFFHCRPITPESQQSWFDGYLRRPDDFLFMVMAAERAVGCIGIRLREAEWDLYNVIRGVHSAGSSGFMSHALAAVMAFARQRCPAPIRADVLTGNPALSWYLRNGFVIVGENVQSVTLRHLPESTRACLQSG